MKAKVFLVDRCHPFIAHEVEFMESGWLRAVGHWRRWDVDDETDAVVIHQGTPRECFWPPHRVKEVRNDV